MFGPMSLKIAGLGRYVPEMIVTDSDIEEKCGLPKGWVREHTGVIERRRCAPFETNSFIGARAAMEAVQDAGITLADIDLIINASGTPERAIPDGAPLLQRALGLEQSGIACFSVHGTCLSFLFALDVAASLLATERYRHILIVSAEVVSPGINYNEPEAASLFGDLAVAAVVRRTHGDETSQLLTSRFETYSEGADYCTIRGCGTERPPNDPKTRPEDSMFHMDGPRVFKMAQKCVPDFLNRLRPNLSNTIADLDFIIPHQASLLALRYVLQRKLKVPAEKMIINIDKFGNCVAASIPGALYDAVKMEKVKRGDEILLTGTGAGLSLGGIILRY